ncbi:MAG: glycoside hydrolase family 2 protein [Patescibacteria group bacterium]
MQFRQKPPKHHPGTPLPILTDTYAPRQTIDLGLEPWAFNFVETPARPDLALGRPVAVGGTAERPVFTVDLGCVRAVGAVRFAVDDTAVTDIRFTIAGGATEDAWTTLPARTMRPAPLTEAAVAEKAGSVGFVERAVGAYCEREFKIDARFIRLELEQWAGAPMPRTLRLEVFAPGRADGDDLRFARPEYDDRAWERVGVPHCFNETDTYLNHRAAPIRRGIAWYRRRLRLGADLAGRRLHLFFEGVNVAAAVYVNGRFKPGVTAVPQPGEVTHVGGFLPFTVDITDDVRPGENVIAVRVGNAARSFFTWPGFGVFEGFCMGWGGLVCPVRLAATGGVHIPLDAYAAGDRCGSYFATTLATRERVEVRHLTQVANDGVTAVTAVLETAIVDPEGRTVLALRESKPVPAGAAALFEGAGVIENPRLWFPNASPHGAPVLHRAVQRVLVDGREVDRVERRIGLRTLDWDGDFCYVNGEKHLLRGFGQRNAYPALGSAVPAALQWQDMRHIAAAGGNALRVGHVPAMLPTVEACDELGILVIMNSGDNEWSLADEPAASYKQEYDRAMMAAFRNHASIAVWEANNGLAKEGAIVWPDTTRAAAERWDSLRPRIVLTRDGYPKEHWREEDRIVVGYSNEYRKVAGSPSLNTEVYGARWDGRPSWNAARFDYGNEKTLAAWFVDDYLRNIDDSACGWIHWMLAESQGEGYTIHLNGMRDQRSLGSCAMDGNRLPKLLYHIFARALWVPFSLCPGVALQSHWNLDGRQDVDAWSNCPAVELVLNGRSLGAAVPDARTRRCTWPNVAWEPGKLAAIGLDAAGNPVCRDERVTAGPPYRLRVEFEPAPSGPGGIPFPLRANGSDAAIATVTVVDAAGTWCPHADHAIRFGVAGPGVYRGSYNFYATPGRGLHYHSPGDPELLAEGGLMRVAVRTTFTPGTIAIRAEADGLLPGEAECVAIAARE